MVVGGRRGKSHLLRERLGPFRDGTRKEREPPASWRGGESPGRRGWRMTAERISIAIPTGVLTKGALELLDRSGLVGLSAEELGRQLLVEGAGLRVILVR